MTKHITFYLIGSCPIQSPFWYIFLEIQHTIIILKFYPENSLYWWLEFKLLIFSHCKRLFSSYSEIERLFHKKLQSSNIHVGLLNWSSTNFSCISPSPSNLSHIHTYCSILTDTSGLPILLSASRSFSVIVNSYFCLILSASHLFSLSLYSPCSTWSVT